jgi:hypothetical protein
MSQPSWPAGPPEPTGSQPPAPGWPQPPPGWPQPPAYPVWPEPAPQQPWEQFQQQPWPPTYPVPAPPPRKSRTGLVILVVVLVLVVLGGSAAVAGYVWLGDTVRAAQTRVETPTTLVGRPQITDAQFVALVDDLLAQIRRGMPQATSTAAGLYGDPATLDLVVMAAVSGRLDDPAKHLNGTFEGAGRAGLSVSDVTSVDPGPLGGEARCATGRVGPMSIVLCAWADPGSLGLIAYYMKENVQDVAAEFVTARGQVERRG